MPFTVGETVGPYRIMEQMGQGGMATVFKAYHAALDRYVALKVLHPAFLEDPNFLARFQREARLVAKLDHPNIVPIYDYAEYEGRPYLVMKYIEGETLKARLVKDGLQPEAVEQAVDAIGLALSYAHKRGVLHRDIKPSNVLLADDGQVYLADFGLARIAQSGESTLTSDMILGTPQYISPEQAMGRKDLDEGTDIYSFGVMLYELAVGQVPFSADTPFSIIHDHIYSPLPLPQKVNPNVSDGMERVLLKALSKDRGDRYKDVHSMVDAFKKAWREMPGAALSEAATVVALPVRPGNVPAGEAPGAEPQAGAGAEPAAGLPPKPRRKVPWMWVAVGVALCIACVFLAFTLRSINQNKPLRATQAAAPLEAVTGSPDPRQATGLESAKQKVIDNPDDPRVRLDLVFAYAAVGDTEGAERELETAYQLGGEDIRFFIDAGYRFAERQSWLAAARMFVRALELQKQAGNTVDEPFRTAVHQAVYMAAEFPQARDYIPFSKYEPLDPSMYMVADARYIFYNIDQADGQAALEAVRFLKEGMYETDLLLAEFIMELGRADEARPLLETLLSKTAVHEWIKSLADEMLNSIP